MIPQNLTSIKLSPALVTKLTFSNMAEKGLRLLIDLRFASVTLVENHFVVEDCRNQRRQNLLWSREKRNSACNIMFMFSLMKQYTCEF